MSLLVVTKAELRSLRALERNGAMSTSNRYSGTMIPGSVAKRLADKRLAEYTPQTWGDVVIPNAREVRITELGRETLRVTQRPIAPGTKTSR